MNLIIFDIDGTLVEKDIVNTKTFFQVIESKLQIKVSNNWADYQQSTDSGILWEICQKHFQRPPCESEINAIQHAFIQILSSRLIDHHYSAYVIPGAVEIFRYIHNLGVWHIAIATGGWQRCAMLKLAHANISHVGIPKAFAEDHIMRAEIIKVAIARAKSFYGAATYQRCIYVGDRMWDNQAAQSLNIEFIAVGSEFYDNHQGREQSLKTVLDYSDPHSFLNLMK